MRTCGPTHLLYDYLAIKYDKTKTEYIFSCAALETATYKLLGGVNVYIIFVVSGYPKKKKKTKKKKKKKKKKNTYARMHARTE